MTFLQLLSQYASPQALLAATVVGPFIVPVFNELKPVIDSVPWLDPSKPVHDLVIKLCVLLLDFGGVALFMWLTKAQENPRDLVWAGIATFASYLIGQAVYVAGRGPVPVTATTHYVKTVVERHGDVIAAALADPAILEPPAPPTP